MGMLCGLASLVVVASVARAAPAEEVSIKVSPGGRAVSGELFGAFFEEISHAGIGGLHAEMVSSRSFWVGRNEVAAWSVLGGCSEPAPGACPPITTLLDQNRPLNANLSQSLRLPIGGAGGVQGAANSGFWGMALREGAAYNFTAWVAHLGIPDLEVALEGDGGTALRSNTLSFPLPAGDGWAFVTGTLVATANDPGGGRIAIRAGPGAAKEGSVLWLGYVSLIPQSSHRGLREDLVKLLKEMRPAHLRFPGGCFVQGITLDTSFKWKRTVGPPWTRPSQFNSVWGYTTDNALGFLEYLQLAEDLGAEPVWVVGAGIALTEERPTRSNEAFQHGVQGEVQDTLDGLEYASGNTSTFWGALRAAHGRIEPFRPFKFLAIGNEACNTPFMEYPGNYLAHASRIQALYPSLQLIANCDLATGLENRVSFPTGYPLGNYWPKQPLPWPPVERSKISMWDFHTYPEASYFQENAAMFDGYNRSWPAVYVSEYAAKCYTKPPDSPEPGPNCTTGTLHNALREAHWMLGLERNGDVIRLAAYAPLLQAAQYANWAPNLIHFNLERAFGTPSYHVQRAFGRGRVDAVLPHSVHADPSVANFTASVGRSRAGKLVFKLVNLHPSTWLRVSLDLPPALSPPHPSATWEVVGGEGQEAWENSFDEPEKVAAVAEEVGPDPAAPSRLKPVLMPPSSMAVLTVNTG